MAVTKEALVGWVLAAIQEHGGKARIVPIAEYIWKNHENELRDSGALFFTWQYDMRWAATELRRRGLLKPSTSEDGRYWELTGV